METRSEERSAPARNGARRTHPAWKAIQAYLEAHKRDLLTRIHAYPPPITACDDQFNWLLERRDAVAGELARLDATVERGAAEREVDVAVDAFLRTSPCIDADATRRLRAAREV